jgi:glycosyltransferase involved in cell wall biosynthesis
MNACDVGCLSSSFGEAFPNVLAEFLACARPCITTDVGDAAMIVERFGKVVPRRDPQALADALIELAETDDAGRNALGAAGRRSILDRFDIAAVAERHIHLWERTAEAAR